MFQKIYTSLFCLFAFTGNAQTILSGTVTEESGEPLIGANVFLADTYDGATTDVNGHYQFETWEEGTQTLVVTFVGFEKVEQPVALDQNQTIDLRLKESFNTMDAVTISAGTFEASDKKKTVVLQSLDIATTAGATADITGALNTLPGTQKVGESGRLFVRGGTADETHIFVDGAEASNYYSTTATNIPTRSRFSPFLFKGTFFSTGGFSAEYGQAMSSALILNTLDVAPKSKVDISLMSVGVDVGVTKAWTNQSIYAQAAYMNLNPYNHLIDQRINWKNSTTSWNGTLAYKWKFKNGGSIKSMFTGNSSGYSFNRQTIISQTGQQYVAVNNKNIFGTVNLQYPVGKNDQLYIGASASRNQDHFNYNETEIQRPIDHEHFKVKYVHEFTPKTVLNTGVEVFGQIYHESIVDTTHDFELAFHNTNPAVFAELDQYLSEKWMFRLGMRSEFIKVLNSYVSSPRFSMAYKLDENSQVSLAAGKYAQTPKADYLKITRNLDVEQANHYILNYQKVKDGKVFRAETYLKDYKHLVRYQSIYDPRTYANTGYGYAYGFDVFWRDRGGIKNVDYWVSYSWMKSERLFQNYPVKAAPGFSSAHNLSVVFKQFFPAIKSQIGATYSFTTGRPYNNPNLPGFNQSRTKAYQDLSFNMAYLPTPRVILYFSATNVLGFNQVFGYNYSPVPNENGVYASEAVKLPAKRFLFIGCFITIGAFNKQLENL